MCPTAPGAIGHRSLCMSISCFRGNIPRACFASCADCVPSRRLSKLLRWPLSGCLARHWRASVCRAHLCSGNRRTGCAYARHPAADGRSAPYMIVGALCPARSCRAIRQAGRVQIGAVAQNSGGGKGRDERLRRPCLCLVPCPAHSE